METDTFPYVAAKYQKPGNSREVLWLCIHCMQAPQTEGRAKACAQMFANPSRVGSAHYCVDDKETYQCVYDSNIAAGAVGANTNGIHIEQAGYAEDTELGDPAHPESEFWEDDYGKAMIERVADLCAQLCLKFNLPPVLLSDADYFARKKGIISHEQVTRVAKAHNMPQTGHTDPGDHYPWDFFSDCLNNSYAQHKIG